MEELDPELRYSPYFAGMAGKTNEQKGILEDRIDALPERSKDILFDPELPERLKTLIDQHHVPDQYILALAKILFLTILGDVPASSIEDLLTKLDLAPDTARNMGREMPKLLGAASPNRPVQAVTPQKMQEMPAMSRATETGPKPIPSSGTPARNIIDLRSKS